MATWKFVVSDPESRRSGQKEVEQNKAAGLLGKKIGDEFSGDMIELAGYTLKITGGSDKDGFPMYPSLEGIGRRKLLISGTPGFHPKIKGQRKRKHVRGNTISADMVQINCKVVKKGSKSFEELFPKKDKPEEKKEEKPKEEPKKEEKKEAPKKEKIEEEKNGEAIGGEGIQNKS